MTAKEAARRTGKSEATIRRWIRKGKLDATMVGGKYRIEESAIDTHMERGEQTDNTCNGRESVEIECLLSQNTELSRQIAQKKATIENQKKVIGELESWMSKKQQHAKEVSADPEPVTAQHIAIGTYTRRYEDGEVIFEEGSNDKDMYFIVSGEVEVSQAIRNSKMIVATLETGDFFGEMAPLTGDNRTMTIAAKGSVYLWKMSEDEMMQYMRLSSWFAAYMCIKMSQRLGYANLLLRHLAVKNLPASSDEDEEGEVLRYMFRKLTEKTEELKNKNEELRKKEREIRELQSELKSQRPSLFLRGLERRKQERPGF